MQFMVRIVVHLPGVGPKEKVEELAARETARGMQCIQEGKLRRIFRIVGQRANFSIWEAATLEELHATLLSLPMHPFFELEVTPIIEHSTTQAWNAAHSTMPPF